MVLVSSISNFFINKISRANKWTRKKIPTCSNSSLWVGKKKSQKHLLTILRFYFQLYKKYPKGTVMYSKNFYAVMPRPSIGPKLSSASPKNYRLKKQKSVWKNIFGLVQTNFDKTKIPGSNIFCPSMSTKSILYV